MNEREIINFKNLLKSMNFYQDKVRELTTEIDDIQYQLNGVHGVNLEGIRGTGEKQWNYELTERKDYYEKQREAYIVLLNIIRNVFAQVSEETKEALIEIYVENNTYDNVAEKRNYSKNGIFYKIHSELKKATLY